MQLLVSTPLHILSVDIGAKSKKVLREGDGYYYGITHNGVQIALTHSEGYMKIYGDGTPVKTFKHLIQPHQLEWIDDRIYVTNTGRNCISIFDSGGVHRRDVYLTDIRHDFKDQYREGNHFNSIHRFDNQVYVLAHNYHRFSEVFQLSWPDLRVLNKKTCNAGGAHNFWICEWGWVICDSNQSGLQEINTGKTIWALGNDQYITRGLAASDNFIFVGCSRKTKRKERRWTTSKIVVIDRKTLRTEELMDLPGSGEINEIRLLGISDECHNREILDPFRLGSITRVSPILSLAHRMRRRYPALQRDLFPMSQFVRAAQLINRKVGKNLL